MPIINKLKDAIRPRLTRHQSNGSTPLILSAIPRGGSTWIMEILGALDGMRMIAEPFNIRVSDVENSLSLSNWGDLLSKSSMPSRLDYMRQIDQGDLAFLNPNPFVQRRFRTNRTLFKVIHLPVHISLEMAVELQAKFVCLIRHPIPVSLSRKVFPILNGYSNSEYRTYFTVAQNDFADGKIKNGTHLEKGVIAWCLHFEPYLRGRCDKRTSNLICYEHCVANTEKVLAKLEMNLGENFPNNIKNRALTPSRVISKSDSQTQSVLRSNSGDGSRVEHLTSRWLDQVSSDERDAVQQILDVYGIKLYSSREPMPIDVI